MTSEHEKNANRIARLESLVRDLALELQRNSDNPHLRAFLYQISEDLENLPEALVQEPKTVGDPYARMAQAVDDYIDARIAMKKCT